MLHSVFKISLVESMLRSSTGNITNANLCLSNWLAINYSVISAANEDSSLGVPVRRCVPGVHVWTREVSHLEFLSVLPWGVSEREPEQNVCAIRTNMFYSTKREKDLWQRIFQPWHIYDYVLLAFC